MTDHDEIQWLRERVSDLEEKLSRLVWERADAQLELAMVIAERDGAQEREEKLRRANQELAAQLAAKTIVGMLV